MGTKKQNEANLANATKSTGPTSAEGKAISAANAIKHGIYSERPTAIRRGYFEENPEEVNGFLSGIAASLNPRDAAEDAVAERFAMYILRLARLDRFEAEALAGDTASRVINGDIVTVSQNLGDPVADREDAAARAIDHTFERASLIDSRLAQGLERSLKVYAMLRSRSWAEVNAAKMSSERTPEDDAILVDFEAKIRNILGD